MVRGIGIDLVDIVRIAAMVERFGLERLERIFSPTELAYAATRPDPARHLAARFAAKEAAYKALCSGERIHGLGFRDAEVVMSDDEVPALRLHGPALERLAQLGATRIHLSLTHADKVAGAIVVLDGD